MTEKNLNIEKKHLSKKTKIGTYTFIITLLFLAVLVIVNLLISALPKSLTVFDTSATGLYTISDSTKVFLDKIEEKVTLHWICEGGVTDPTIATFLDRYTSYSSNISYNILDPITDPGSLDKYLTDADTKPTNFSFIIESERRHRIIDSMEMFYYYNAYVATNYGMTEPVPYNVYMYYNAYPYFIFSNAESNGTPTEQYFYGDDTITKAIEYVTLENIPHIFILEGHGETQFSEPLLNFIASNNIEYETLRLAEHDSIPEDASCIVIYAPNFDLSPAETQIISEYLTDGGNLLLITEPDNVGMSGLMGLMEPYGVSPAAGMVYEGNTSKYRNTPYTLIPDVNTSHSVTAAASTYTMIMPKAHGIIVGEDTGSTTVTKLFTTSDSAYIKLGETKSVVGSTTLGVALSAQGSNDDTQIVWYSSADAFTDETAQSSSYGNYYYLFYTLYWMNESYESSLSDVIGIPISEPTLDGLTQTSIYMLAAIFTLIPVAIATIGFVIWRKRQKR